MLISLVAGTYYFLVFKNNPPAGGTPSPTPVAEPTPDPTADWKTYTSNKYSFKYPVQLNLTTTENGIVLKDDEKSKPLPTPIPADVHFKLGYGLSFETVNLNNITLKKWVDSEFEKDPSIKLFQFKEKTMITAQNYEGWEYGYATLQKFHIYAIQSKQDTSNFILITDFSVLPNLENNNELTQQILSTFKFTENSSGLETFQSKKIENLSYPAVSINYPSGWNKEVEESSRLRLTLSKNGYSIQITQDAWGGAACLFDDSPNFEGSSVDLRGKSYTELKINSGLIFRRYKTDFTTNNLATINFCQQESVSPYFVTPGIIASIQYSVPQNFNKTMLEEMDSIIKTIEAK
ncbi:hypothetical protein A2125_00555 [Candidatus Woesebacteria bacterium GWB1_43_5]|uniref:Uncharacterized protein n=1 Tax=Candidatus Woesebacteria bacterium GWB1_43_5 TaxID=1802474 RepID=A0A1F7WTV6_9BACT|nr:MAG: hypothetical protein A2125_00555 [Candidatus Woesebacteria bacterium GWB1_43_5]